MYLSVINRHAPLKHKRVKHPKLPPWLNKDIMQIMAERDKLKKEKRFSEYKKLRNKRTETNQLRKAKKDNFQKLTERDKKYFECVACSKYIHEREPVSFCRYPKEPNG